MGRKQLKRAPRLASARAWLSTYQGTKLVRAYRQRYGVDYQTAFQELELLGVEINPAYKEQVLATVQQQAELKRQKKSQQTTSIYGEWEVDYDDDVRRR